MFYGAAHGISVQGPTLLHVGERSSNDKKFATDEFVLAPPGTVVAPRPQGMKATPENAARAIMAQLSGLDLSKAEHGAEVATIPAEKACKILEDGTLEGKPLTPEQQRFFSMICQGEGQAGPPQQGGPQQQAGPPQGGPPPEALAALQQILAQQGGGGGALPQAADGAQVAPGAQSMADLLQKLLQDGGFSIDMLLGIFSLMNSLGIIVPEAIGVTDVQDLRDIFGGDLSGSLETLQSRQFGETQRVNNASIMAQLGVIIPGLLGKTGRKFDAGLARALDPGLINAAGNFEGGTGNIGEIGRAVRDVQPLKTLAAQQQEFNNALTGFRSFGLGQRRPSVASTSGI